MSSLIPASHTIVAVYLGDGNFAGSSSPSLTQVVNPADTTLALSASSSAITAGAPLTLTAILSVVPPGSFLVPPTGTVSFYDTFDGITTLLSSGPLGGSENFSPLTAVGAHFLTATYSGDADFHGCTSNTIEVDVMGSAGALAQSGSPDRLGEPIPGGSAGELIGWVQSTDSPVVTATSKSVSIRLT
jgi:hypothetical protein